MKLSPTNPWQSPNLLLSKSILEADAVAGSLPSTITPMKRSSTSRHLERMKSEPNTALPTSFGERRLPQLEHYISKDMFDSQSLSDSRQSSQSSATESTWQELERNPSSTNVIAVSKEIIKSLETLVPTKAHAMIMLLLLKTPGRTVASALTISLPIILVYLYKMGIGFSASMHMCGHCHKLIVIRFTIGRRCSTTSSRDQLMADAFSVSRNPMAIVERVGSHDTTFKTMKTPP